MWGWVQGLWSHLAGILEEKRFNRLLARTLTVHWTSSTAPTGPAEPRRINKEHQIL